MDINQYLETTYLKTPEQAGISSQETEQKIIQLTEEAIQYNFKLIMVRTTYIRLVKKLIDSTNSKILVGTVIGFHEGTKTIREKLEEATQAISLGAEELDFVINYLAFKEGKTQLITEEILKATELCLNNNKVIKWIIEVAALTNDEIIVLSQLIKNIVINNFGVENTKNVYVKSSTGFYKTVNNKPNGATGESIKLIVENSSPLQVKAAGGVRNFNNAKKMIDLGVHRIGTSSAKKIADEQVAEKG